jgi:hypothetical protein
VIPPGGIAPFETGTDEWAGTVSYKLQVEGRPGELRRQDLKVIDHERYTDGDWLHIRGEVKNEGQTPATFVKVVVTLYDSAHHVVGIDYTLLDEIPAEGTAPFETETDHWPDFHHYEVQVEGR